MSDKKSKIQAAESAANGAESEPSLGHVITEARERKGLTREQVATEAHLPPHYVKMIETDSYDMISDRLYLVPFLRRYATFLGLDAEEIASRFVSNVQHAEANVVRISQEITMVEKKPGSSRPNRVRGPGRSGRSVAGRFRMAPTLRITKLRFRLP